MLPMVAEVGTEGRKVLYIGLGRTEAVLCYAATLLPPTSTQACPGGRGK